MRVSIPNGLHRPFRLTWVEPSLFGETLWFQSQTGSTGHLASVEAPQPKSEYSLQLHLEKEELSLESSWESSLEPHPLRAFLASMCHARSCNPSDWYPSSKARTT